MGNNSNIRNCAIHNARKHAFSRLRSSQQQGTTTITTTTRNDKKEFFDYNRTTHLNASDMYHANEDGYCQSGVKGLIIYKKGHHHTCSKSSKYCDQKQGMWDNIKQQLKFEGTNIGTLCNPETGVILNLEQSLNRKLVPIKLNSTEVCHALVIVCLEIVACCMISE